MKRNVLFLLADDQRFDTIHALGNNEIKTPNLDRLVENGVSFENAYIPGGTSGAVCMPSRAMMHTSKHLFDLQGLGATIPNDHAILGEELQKNNYNTIGIGKWHNGTKGYSRAFSDGGEIFFGGMWDHWNVPVNEFDITKEYKDLRTFTQDPFSSKRTIDLPADHITLGKHSTDLFADKLIEKIYAEAENEEPFFLYGAFLAPHDPRTMPKEFQNMYDPDQISLPENYLPEHPFEFDVKGERDETLEAYPRPAEKIKQHMADYYAMISHIDARIGTILQALEETGQLENTLIIYSGDNGLSIGQHGLMGKQNLYEHSIHVPLIMSGPGLPEGKRVKERALLLDIMPTILEYTETPIPEGLFGHSLLPIISGDAKGRDTIYLSFTTKIRGLLKDNYKLIEYATKFGRHTQLFDIVSDPKEMNNLANVPEFLEKTAEMQVELVNLADAMGDFSFPQGKEYWAKKAELESK
ncbi:sulfatase-like hydrolase/transferase [Enterococcus diestrammenae]|uniref:sulfatase-like hydrolase/transferase n=1 Tax=Enterococcus diestrammenae TaxID=1155073 RepID=UPI00195ADE67